MDFLRYSIKGKDYLCVSSDVERKIAQPVRLGAALILGPLLVYASGKVRDRKLGGVLAAAGVAVAGYNGWVWKKARELMREK